VIAHYAAAPLVLLLPGLVCLLLGQAVGKVFSHAAVALALGVAGVVSGVLGVAATVWRVGQWAARVRHAGAGTAVLAGLELVGLWLLGLLLLLGCVPWLIGFFRVVVDSYR
jgi:hypothetical protein